MSFMAKVAMLRREFGLEEATPIPVAVAKAAQFMGIVPELSWALPRSASHRGSGSPATCGAGVFS